jgi:hypothetical protein
MENYTYKRMRGRTGTGREKGSQGCCMQEQGRRREGSGDGVGTNEGNELPSDIILCTRIL